MYFIAENTKYKFKRNDSLDRKFVATIIYRRKNCKESSDTDRGTSIIGKVGSGYNNTGGTLYTVNENTGGHTLE